MTNRDVESDAGRLSMSMAVKGEDDALKPEPRRLFGHTVDRLSQSASAFWGTFRLLVCTSGVSLVLASCSASAGHEGFSVDRFDSLVSRLADPAFGASNVSPSARADTLCADASPDSDTVGAAVNSSSRSDPGAHGTARALDRVREELAKMGFDAICVRATSRTVQRDTWLRHDRLTELVAWNGDVEVEDAIYVPVRYRPAARGEAEMSDSSWARPVAAVLEAVRAFLADSAQTANGEPSDSTAGKTIVLSLSSAKQPNGLGDLAAPKGSLAASTAWMTFAAGPPSPRVNVPDVGWMVGKVRPTGGRVAFPGPDIELPVLDSAGSPLCESGERCDLIVPANPALHVHAMFFPDDSRFGNDEARRMGERTLEVLLAADTVPYGVVLPVSRAELMALLWWLLPCGLAVLTVGLAFSGLLGPINAAIRRAHWARMIARLNLLGARCWHFVLGIVLYFLRRIARKREISEGTRAIARTRGLCDKVDQALCSWAEAHVGTVSGARAHDLLTEAQTERSRLGRWAKEATAWEKRKDDLYGKVADCEDLVSACVKADEDARSAGQTARSRMDAIRSSLRDVEQQQELANKMKREADKAPKAR